MNRFLLILLLSPFVLWAQDAYVGSLNFALKKAKHDTIKIKLLNELSELCEIDEILFYAESCQQLCIKALKSNPNNSFYLRNLSDAINNIGFVAEQQGDSDKALEHYQRSLKIREGLNDKIGMATSYNNIGVIYKNFGNIPKALDYYHKSLKIREEILLKHGIAESLNNIGIIYRNQGDFPKALEYSHKSLKLYEEIRDKEGIAYSLNNIGVIYRNQGKLNKAIAYFTKSMVAAKE